MHFRVLCTSASHSLLESTVEMSLYDDIEPSNQRSKPSRNHDDSKLGMFAPMSLVTKRPGESTQKPRPSLPYAVAPSHSKAEGTSAPTNPPKIDIQAMKQQIMMKRLELDKAAPLPSGFFSNSTEPMPRSDLPTLKAHKVDVTQIRGVNVVPMDVRDEAECLFDEVHIIDEYKPDQPNNYVDFMRSINCDPQFGEEIDDSRLERLIQAEIISGQKEREERTPSPKLQRPAPSGGAIAANIMAKMGYTQGSGLGKHGQGISQALRVEKKAGQAGKIVSELDEVMLSVGMNPETFNRPITNVLLMRNVYTNDDLPENFEAELKPELDRYGVVRKIQLKRQTTAEDPMEQVRVFVDYANKAAAVRAFASLNNRYFSERAIRVDFYPSERFSMGYFFDPI